MTVETTTRPHELAEDIRAVVLIEKLAEVNHRGEVIGQPTVISEAVQQRGWRCLPCDADFHQWGAVEAHLRSLCRANTPTGQGSAGGSDADT